MKTLKSLRGQDDVNAEQLLEIQRNVASGGESWKLDIRIVRKVVNKTLP